MMFCKARLMSDEVYVVATLKPWNLKIYNEVVRHYPGRWHLITEPRELTAEKIQCLNPKYIFFPHWSYMVPEAILSLTDCVCFHETDLPYGRGGSPLQNLICRGHSETVITAIKMSQEIDAGPVYLKRSASLEGLAEEVFIRVAKIIAEMIKEIASNHPIPDPQNGSPSYFKRKKPEDSRIPQDKPTLKELFDHIRMLDAETYPRAFIEYNGFRYEISRPALRTNEILADVRITRIEGEMNA
jgi:methionyl-tRNA formyltransferase